MILCHKWRSPIKHHRKAVSFSLNFNSFAYRLQSNHWVIKSIGRPIMGSLCNFVHRKISLSWELLRNLDISSFFSFTFCWTLVDIGASIQTKVKMYVSRWIQTSEINKTCIKHCGRLTPSRVNERECAYGTTRASSMNTGIVSAVKPLARCTCQTQLLTKLWTFFLLFILSS